ncbi:putative Lipoprotein, putative [Mycoplasmopsis canis PG 14]|uniref:Lipoprotein n=1 Tax=Mycoplasmopsis canis TaxID=29555 RepID=A0A449AR24_9BACT|nr:hypothetical protein [Mycoplasmopsis canis]AMD81201.1 hypothetical protein AXW82_01325 [Mycoplasmopsis canis PG 14]EIE39734.1 putative Lipoprotein, putative [Mycoplasmopsis canis PG 14]VEU69025.1 Uncharacterised protein [Mycoplasmopsis canis]
MKLKLPTKLIALSIVPSLGLVTSCSCSQNNKDTEKKEKEYKTFEAQFSNNILWTDWDYYNEFIERLNEIPQLPDEYKQVNVRVSKLQLNEVFERKYFEDQILAKINKIDLKFKIDLTERTLLNLDPKTSSDLKEVEKLLQKDFNNYYVNESWFVDVLKNKIKLAESGINKNDGKITLDSAQKNNKLNEYNEVVNEIKNFLNEHANISIDDEIKISEINQDTVKGWSLIIKLKSGNLESNSIKLDFKKPEAELTDEQIKDKNLSNSITKKVKLKINEYFDDSKLEGFFKFIRFLVLVDKNGLLNEKITDLIYNIVLDNIPYSEILPKFVLRALTSKLRPQIEKFVDKIVFLMRAK